MPAVLTNITDHPFAGELHLTYANIDAVVDYVDTQTDEVKGVLRTVTRTSTVTIPYTTSEERAAILRQHGVNAP